MRHRLRTVLLALACLALAVVPRRALPADGTWIPVGVPSPRAYATVVIDSARDRLVAFGGWDGAYRNDVWVLPLGGASPAWRALAPAGSPPSPRSSHAVVYDAAADRLIVFGGLDATGPLGDVWALSLGATPAWTQLSPTGPAPTARFGHSAIFDAPRGRVLFFGGDDGGLALLDEVRALSLGTSPAWSVVGTSGPAPAGRSGHTAILDAPRSRMIVFGGTDGTVVLADAGALDLTNGHWSAFSPSGTGPGARTSHVAGFDPVANLMVVQGGFDGALRHADAWGVNLVGGPAWTALAPTGAAPAPRSGHAAAFDAARERLVLFAGYASGRRGDAHALSLAGTPAWSVVASPAAPSPRYRHAATPDPLGGALVVGGYDGTFPYPTATWRESEASGTWSVLAPTGPGPTGRYAHTMVWDPVARRAVAFGGYDGAARLAELWSIAVEPVPAWSPLAAGGAPPSGRQNHTAVRDARRHRMLVFGGYDGARRNDAWALPLEGAPAWEPLAPLGVPPSARGNHAAVYDPVRDRMLVLGGSDGTYLSDVWELSFAGAPQWTQLFPTGPPPSARVGHAVAYDPIRDRVVIFGGDDLAFRDDAWALSLAGPPAWTQLAPTGAAPPGRRFHAAFYDPWCDGLWMHGGWDGDYRADAAVLRWGAPSRPWAEGPGPLTVVPGRSASARLVLRHALGAPRALEWRLAADRAWPGWPLHGFALVGALPDSVPVIVAIPDSAAAGVAALRLSVGFVGAEGNDSTTVHALTVQNPPTAVEPGTGAPFAILALAPNPGRGPFVLALRTPLGGVVSLEWFDVGGRRVGAAPAVRVAPETPVLALDPPAHAGAGLHFVRARFGTEAATARVVLLR